MINRLQHLNKRLTIACGIQFVILLIISWIYYCLDKWAWQTKDILEILLFFVVIQSFLLHTYFHKTWKNLNNLFIAFFFFFLGTRFLFDFFSEKYNVCYFEFFLNRQVSLNVVNRAILNLIIALCSYNIGALCYRQYKQLSNGDGKIQNLLSIDTLPNSFIYTLLGIGFIAKLYFSYQVFIAMLNYGYLSFFIDGFDINRNLIMMFAETFYEIAIFLIISRTGKIKKWEILFIIAYCLMSMATGQRGLAMLSVVFIIFYLVKLGKLRIKLIHSIFLVLILFMFAQVVGNLRGGKEIYFSDLFDSFADFFYGQAISITVLVTTIDYDSQINFSFWDLFGHIRYLIEYYWNKITLQSPPAIDALTLQAEEYKWYGQYISSIANETMFYQGLGLGSSYVGQLFAVGKEYAQFLGGIFVGFLAELFYHGLSSSNLLKRFYAFHALTIFIFIPRANIFEFISMQWASYIVALFLYFFLILRVKSLLVNSL